MAFKERADREFGALWATRRLCSQAISDVRCSLFVTFTNVLLRFDLPHSERESEALLHDVCASFQITEGKKSS